MKKAGERPEMLANRKRYHAADEKSKETVQTGGKARPKSRMAREKRQNTQTGDNEEIKRNSERVSIGPLGEKHMEKKTTKLVPGSILKTTKSPKKRKIFEKWQSRNFRLPPSN